MKNSLFVLTLEMKIKMEKSRQGVFKILYGTHSQQRKDVSGVLFNMQWRAHRVYIEAVHFKKADFAKVPGRVQGTTGDVLARSSRYTSSAHKP